MSSVASPPLPSFARRFARFVFTLLLLAAIFAGGVAVGARWGDRLPPPIGRTPPAPPPPAPSDSPSGDSLLASVDGRLVDLSDQYAEAERAEREAEVALKLLRNQGRPADHAAVREQEQLRARAATRKAELTAEQAEYVRLRAELVAAMAEEQSRNATGQSDLSTHVRKFVIHQELLRDPAPKPRESSAP